MSAPWPFSEAEWAARQAATERLSTLARLRETQGALAASQADLTRALAERTELLSILARIGDAISPTGERPQEALGTLAADVEALMETLPCGWCGGVGEAQEELFGRDADGAPMVDGPQPCPEGCQVPAWLEVERREAREDLAAALAERDEWKSTADQIAARLSAATDALVRAEDEITGFARSNWLVARDGGRDCIDCGGEIRRGEAYLLRPGVDELAHIHCPTENRG